MTKSVTDWTFFLNAYFKQEDCLAAVLHLRERGEINDNKTFLKLVGYYWRRARKLWTLHEKIEEHLPRQLLTEGTNFYLMTRQEDCDAYDRLKPNTKVYRGGFMENLGGWSWTTDYAQAKYHAKQCASLGEVYVAWGMAPKDCIYTTIAHKNHTEVIINPGDLSFYKVKEIKNIRASSDEGAKLDMLTRGGAILHNPEVLRAQAITRAKLAKDQGLEKEHLTGIIEKVEALAPLGFAKEVQELRMEQMIAEQVFNGVLKV